MFMPFATLTWVLVWAGLVLALLFRYGRRSSALRHLPLPPGPRPLPLIGNALDIPIAYQWLTYAEWSKKYGDIVHVKFFGKSLIILGSSKPAFDLLERRSSLYSDRPILHMQLLIGFDWCLHRRMMHQYFNSGNVDNFKSMQVAEVHQLLRNLHDDPQNYLRHLRHVMGATIIRVIYGVKDDELITMNQRVMKVVTQTLNPGSFWVDIMPFLKHIPAWFPGAGFQRKAREWKKDILATRVMGLAATKRAISQHDSIALQSITADMLERISNLEPALQDEESEIAENVAAIAYLTGADTVISTLSSFFLAIVRYPEAQEKAYTELMDVVGPHRLPEFSDRESLPYINAVVKESLRWQPVVPLGVAHATIADDEYNGYLIPKGSIIMANSWAILHDPEQYPDPEKFCPERFLKDGRLDPSIRDPSNAAFGFGRRICPGRYFADNMVFITFASILYTYIIRPPIGLDGKPAVPEVKMTSGSLSFPAPFGCIIEPRSSRISALIHN
ncbi:cytochrome P450 [Obba rivulosa]|uniref:Cytochrome P450 n=1 Tax=Obba rivulosa TaxID=1052685 RepID=A0A8E2DMH2_9APHY|nr:cytochrome P450 [Obba rivulosa]